LKKAIKKSERNDSERRRAIKLRVERKAKKWKTDFDDNDDNDDDFNTNERDDASRVYEALEFEVSERVATTLGLDTQGDTWYAIRARCTNEFIMSRSHLTPTQRRITYGNDEVRRYWPFASVAIGENSIQHEELGSLDKER